MMIYAQGLDHYSNNSSEYEALILCLTLVRGEGIENLNIYGDSNLVIKHLQGQWEINSWQLEDKNACTHSLLTRFNSYTLEHIPHTQNTCSDQLVNMGVFTP